MIAFDAGVVLLCLAVLWLVTDKMVAAISSLAQEFRIPQSVAGATLAAVGSSMPEFGTSAFSVTLAAFDQGQGYADIGFGTIVGSAVFNLCLIIGIPALIRPLDVSRRVVTRDSLFYLVACLQTVVFIWDGRIVTWEALVWVLTYCVYLVELFRDIRRHPEEAQPVDAMPNHHAVLWFLASIAAIAVACHFMVKHTTLIANQLGLPTALISIVVLAAGTSIPDLLASIQATRQGNTSLAISNAIGSNVFDILICLGLPVLIYNLLRGAFDIGVIPPALQGSVPPAFSQGLLLLSIVFLLLTVVFCIVVLRVGWTVSLRDGVALIGLYLAFLACLLVLWLGRQEVWLSRLLERLPGT